MSKHPSTPAPHPYLSVQVHAHPQPKVQQSPLAVRCLELHTAHHLEPSPCRLLPVLLVVMLLLGLLGLEAGWHVGRLLLLLVVVSIIVATYYGLLPVLLFVVVRR